MVQLISPAPGQEVQGLGNQCGADDQAYSSNSGELQFLTKRIDKPTPIELRLAWERRIDRLLEPVWFADPRIAIGCVLAAYWRLGEMGAQRKRRNDIRFPAHSAAENLAVHIRSCGGDPEPTEGVLFRLIAAIKKGARQLPAEIGAEIHAQMAAGEGVCGG